MPSVQQVHITPEMILTMLIDQVTFSNVFRLPLRSDDRAVGRFTALTTILRFLHVLLYTVTDAFRLVSPCARTLHPVLVALYTFNGILIVLAL